MNEMKEEWLSIIILLQTTGQKQYASISIINKNAILKITQDPIDANTTDIIPKSGTDIYM